MSRAHARSAQAVLVVKLDNFQHAYDLTDAEMREGFQRWQSMRDLLQDHHTDPPAAQRPTDSWRP